MNRAHLIDRARERYGILLTDADLDGIVAAANDGLLLSRNPEGGEIRIVTVRGIAMKIAWWPKPRRIATILPKEAHAITGIRAGPPKMMDKSFEDDGWHAMKRKKRRSG